MMSCDRHVKTVCPGRFEPCALLGQEKTKQHCSQLVIEESIASEERMRKQPQASATKTDAASKCEIEVVDDLHRDRVDHLLMKSRIGFRRIQSHRMRTEGSSRSTGGYMHRLRRRSRSLQPSCPEVQAQRLVRHLMVITRVASNWASIGSNAKISQRSFCRIS